MRKTLLGSLIVHVALAIGFVQWIVFDRAGDVPRHVYQVSLVEAAQGANTPATARVELAPPPAPAEQNNVKEVPEEMPAPPPEKKPKPEAEPVDLAASTEVRPVETKPDSESVDNSRRRVVSGPRDTRFAIDAPVGTSPVGEAGPGIIDGVESHGSPVPLNISRPESYSETYVILHAVNPKYPDHERERGIEGSVTVEVIVDEQGMVANVNVINQEGPDSFRRSALDAVRQFRFQPPIENGVPSTMWIKFLIKFRINP